MARVRRSLAVLGIVALLGLLSAACGGGAATTGSAGTSASGTASAAGSASPGAQTAGRPVRVGMDVDAGTLDPRLMSDTTAYRVTGLIYDGLVELDGHLQPQPALATSWEQKSPTVWVFHLRQGVKFQDGTPFTAADVVYTYQTILDPSFKAPQRPLYAPIAKVEALDDHTVQFTLSAPYAPLLSYLDMGIVPQHLAQADPTAVAQHPVGTGPFQFVSWDKNSKIVLKANPNWWGGPISVPGVEIDVIPDNTARAAALEAGNVDMVMSPLSPDDVSRMASERGITETKMPGLGFTFFTMNTKDPLLSDVNVRQAIAHLIDQQTIISQIYKGIDTPATSALLPSYPAYSADIRQPTYDPAKAEQILQSDGWQKTGGVWTKDGKPMNLTISTHSEDPNRVQTVEYLQNQFTKFGIPTKVNIHDWPAFFASIQAGDYQIGMLGGLNLINADRALYSAFHTGGADYSRYSNPQVDRWLDQGRQSADPQTQITAYRNVAQQLAQDVPYYFLSYQGYQVAVSDRLTGYVPNPRGDLRSLVQAHLGS
jgi:peptide/nickel transport system substrate-binding protein